MKLKKFKEFSQVLSINETGDLKNITSYNFKLLKNYGAIVEYTFDLIEEDGEVDTYNVSLNPIWYNEEFIDPNYYNEEYYVNLHKKFYELDSLYDVSFGSKKLGYGGVRDDKSTSYIFKILKTIVDILEHYINNRRNSTKIGFCFSAYGGDKRRLNFYKKILENQINLKNMNLKSELIQDPEQFDMLVFY